VGPENAYGWDTVTHPPYSPDIAPSDYHLFPESKKHLGGTHFRTGEELKEEVFSYLRGAAGEFYDSGIKKMACTADYALSRVVQIATQLLITRTVICLTTAQFKSVICKNALISTAIMSKNRGKSKLSKTVLFNANKHLNWFMHPVFHCEKSLGPLFYGSPSYLTQHLGDISVSILCPALPE
jgi:hypothetical protein